MDRPANVVNLEDVQEEVFEKGQFRSRDQFLGQAAGSVNFGLVRTILSAGHKSCPEHAHMAEEELFYVLRGKGTLLQNEDRIPVRPGDTISFPAGTGISHAFVADQEEDLEYLAFGERNPNDVCVYPRSGKILIRSLDKIGRLEEADYFDGEM